MLGATRANSVAATKIILEYQTYLSIGNRICDYSKSVMGLCSRGVWFCVATFGDCTYLIG